MVKTQVVRDFLLETIGPAVCFGNNCFKVQLGTGDSAETVIGICHLVILGGNGKEFDGCVAAITAKFVCADYVWKIAPLGFPH